MLYCYCKEKFCLGYLWEFKGEYFLLLLYPFEKGSGLFHSSSHSIFTFKIKECPLNRLNPIHTSKACLTEWKFVISDLLW